MRIVSQDCWNNASSERHEGIHPDWERTITAFPERGDSVALIEAIAALRPGESVGGIVHIGPEGTVDASAILIGPDRVLASHARDPRTLFALLARSCPGLRVAQRAPERPSPLPRVLLLPGHEQAADGMLPTPPAHDWPWDLGGP